MASLIYDDAQHYPFVMANPNYDNKHNAAPQFYYGLEVETQTPWEEILTLADNIPVATVTADRDQLAFDFMKETGWMPSHDGSVNGVEYKSPLLKAHDPIHERAARHINMSTKDEACGGHIHIYHPTLPPIEIAARIKAFVWLFATLYYKRLDNRYSPLKNAYRDKYNWLHMHPQGTCELRLFPAHTNIVTINFRRKLLEAVLTADQHDSNENTINTFFDHNTAFLRQTLSAKTAISLRKRIGGTPFHTTARRSFNKTNTWTLETTHLLRERWNRLIDLYPAEELADYQKPQPRPRV